MTRPPPMPSPLRISPGKFAHRIMTGYPCVVPKVDSLVLSAYNIIPNGFPSGGRRDCDKGVSFRHVIDNIMIIPEFSTCGLPAKVLQ